MRRLLILIVLLAAGCTPADPASARLAPGQAVMVTLPPRGIAAMIRPLNTVPFDPESPAAKAGALTSGDECRVIGDEEAVGPDRLVAVEVTRHKPALPEYSLVGVRCRVERKYLRPIP